MEEIKVGEGLMKHIRLQEEMHEEMSTVLGIPASLMGNPEKFRPQGVAGLKIMGSAEFIEKFLEGLKDVNE